MLIFFKPISTLKVQPIVVVDYTRSDEQYTYFQIQEKVLSTSKSLGKIPDATKLEIFSLNYRIVYSHSGINLANSLKTSCSIELDNAPSALTNLVNVKQFTSQESALALKSVVKAIIDPQVQFPSCVLIMKNGSNLATEEFIIRDFIIYNTAFNYDSRRITSSLALSGAAFSSMVIQLKTAVNILKTKPLVSQLKTSLASTKYQFEASPDILAVLPKVERYYPPSTMNNILSSVAKDYGLFIDIDDDTKTVKIKSLDPKSAPKSIANKFFCFRGRVPGAKLISNFSVQDFSRAVFETEIEDVKIFDSIIIYDDSGADLLFENFIEFSIPFGKIKAYQFYVQEYTYTDDRMQTKLKLTATNNWVVSNFKLGNFLEAAIYKEHFDLSGAFE